MKRWFVVLIGLLLITPSAGWAASISCGAGGGTTSDSLGAAADEKGATASVMINDELLDLSRCIVDAGKFFILKASFETDAGKGRVDSLMNTDPFITFGATTINLVPGPVTYSFLFGTPILPGFYGKATSTGGVTVTNGIGGTSSVNNSALLPNYITGYGTLGVVMTDLGVGLGVGPCTAGPGAPGTQTTTCDQGNKANTFAPAFYDNLEAILTYTQDDTASTVGWTGGVTLNAAAVPEPASMSLVAMGMLLAGACGIVRRRRS